MIISVGRGRIRMQLGNRIVAVEGEAHLPVPGSPGFVVYTNSIKHWELPAGAVVSAEEKQQIITELIRCAKERDMRVKIE
jgi:hypothetical protein